MTRETNSTKINKLVSDTEFVSKYLHQAISRVGHTTQQGLHLHNLNSIQIHLDSILSQLKDLKDDLIDPNQSTTSISGQEQLSFDFIEAVSNAGHTE